MILIPFNFIAAFVLGTSGGRRGVVSRTTAPFFWGKHLCLLGAVLAAGRAVAAFFLLLKILLPPQ